MIWYDMIRIYPGSCCPNLIAFRLTRGWTLDTVHNLRRQFDRLQYVFANPNPNPNPKLVGWLSGRTLVSDRRTFTGLHRTCSWCVTIYSLGQLTSTDLVSAKWKTKVNWSISFYSFIRQCLNILIRHCNPSRIRNIWIERSKQLYHNNKLPLFPPCRN